MPTPYAPDSYTAGAAQIDFPITFPYLRASHLTVTKDAVAVSTANYSLVSGGTIVRLGTACVGGEAVVISRVTPNGADYRLIDYVAGAGVSETELDEADQQLHYSLEELAYNTDAAALAIALAAAASAASAAETAEDNAVIAQGLAEDAQGLAEDAQTAAELAETNAETALASLLTALKKLPELSRTSTEVVAVSAGVAIDSAGAVILELTSPENIDITAGAVAGGISSRAVSTWYHAFLIKKDSDGSIDVWGDTSVTAANKPAGYTEYRRIGSFKLDATGSGEVVPFVQHGDFFLFTVPNALVLDHNVAEVALTSGITITLENAPPGVRTLVDLRFSAGAMAGGILWQGGDETSTAPTNGSGSPLSDWWTNGGVINYSKNVFSLLTDGASPPTVKFRTETDAAATVQVLVRSWRDSRGQ